MLFAVPFVTSARGDLLFLGCMRLTINFIWHGIRAHPGRHFTGFTLQATQQRHVTDMLYKFKPCRQPCTRVAIARDTQLSTRNGTAFSLVLLHLQRTQRLTVPPARTSYSDNAAGGDTNTCMGKIMLRQSKQGKLLHVLRRSLIISHT